MKIRLPLGFTLLKKGKPGFITCDAINKIPGFTQAFTLRAGGFSKKPFNSLNVGMHTGDDRRLVKKNIRIIEKAFGVKYAGATKQVHGNHVIIMRNVECKMRNLSIQNSKSKIQNTEADALITDIPGLAVGVRVADCAGTIIVDPEKKVVAAVHSGWRGIASKIPVKAIRILRKKFGSNPSKLIAAVSPAIGPCCYEIGLDVYKLKKQKVFSNIFTRRKGRVFMNLWKGVENLLLSEGLKKKNIHICNMCTSDNPDLFFSHRRDKGKTGRMLIFVAMK